MRDQGEREAAEAQKVAMGHLGRFRCLMLEP